MEERILSTKKNGMLVMLLTIVLYLAAIGVTVAGGILLDQTNNPVLLIIGIVYLLLGWIPFMGLKVLKPQEALVLTLFGKYVGTLKDDGFYFVNPFCTSINPAAKTKLSQSGDVDGHGKVQTLSLKSDLGTIEMTNNKISLKVMTLNNSRQKINDCLGNPVEIGIAVMWRVRDTAKAVFNVDN